MTRQEAKCVIENGLRLGANYKHGYCCYQDDKISKWDMIEIGSNTGVYGWNWTLYYYPVTNTYYMNSYRNTPTVARPANYKRNNPQEQEGGKNE